MFVEWKHSYFKEIIYLNASNASKTISWIECSARCNRITAMPLSKIFKKSRTFIFGSWKHFQRLYSECFVWIYASNWMHCWMQSFNGYMMLSTHQALLFIVRKSSSNNQRRCLCYLYAMFWCRCRLLLYSDWVIAVFEVK